MSTAPPDEIAAATLAGLPGVGRATLRQLWASHDGPEAALQAVLAGAAGAGLRRWRHLSDWPAPCRPEVVAARLERHETRVLLPSQADWPIPPDLADAPALLFARGSCYESLQRPAVAIVGTRSASPHGLADAEELAAHAAHAGYVVVSGLALGVDAAAHRGALQAGGLTIGVVATGPDVTYPRRHDALYSAVRDRGLTLGEEGFGAGPLEWRFPVRNRLIAAMASVVVVVEAHERGGALDTARHAGTLGRPLLAVPGSRRNPAAAGTNALLRDGASPLVDPTDLLVALDRARVTTPLRPAVGEPVPADRVPTPAGTPTPAAERSAAAHSVLAACHGDPATLDDLVARTRLGTAQVSGALRELERVGAVVRRHGRIWPT